MIINNPNIRRIGNIPEVSGKQVGKQTGTVSQPSFENILNEKLKGSEEVKFSKHAEMRLKTRNLELTDEQKVRLNEAVGKADAKGIKDSLVLLDNMAFIVSVKNKMVVTCADGNELNENVFTNIDGAIISQKSIK